jgi:hypothetical protein
MMRAFTLAIFTAGAFVACNDSGTSSTDTQSTEIESSADGLGISDSDKLFGGSSAQDSPEGPVATTSSSALPASFSSGQYEHGQSSSQATDPPHASPAESSSSVEPFPES